MACTGKILVNGNKQSCWLPQDKNAPWPLCRRCIFNKITETLDLIQEKAKTNELTNDLIKPLLTPDFQNYMLHPAREQIMISTLNYLFKDESIGRPFVNTLLKSLKSNSLFKMMIHRNIRTHQPGDRCKFYQTYHSEEFCPTLCWSLTCWSCMGYILKNSNNNEILNTISKKFEMINLNEYLKYNESVFIDILETLERRKESEFKNLYEWLYVLLQSVSAESADRFEISVFSQPGMFNRYFLSKDTHSDSSSQKIQSNIYEKILERMVFKEELLEITWHPDYFMRFCIGDSDADHLRLHWFKTNTINMTTEHT